VAHWKCLTLPFPEPGIRLIRQHEIDAFNNQMTGFRTELQQAVEKLDDHYSELKAAAQRRLGDLYDPNDYPVSLKGLFNVEWDFPSVEPPDYLLQLNPAIYDQERARVASRFEEAVQLAEQAFLSEFGKLIEHLTERLTSDTGEKKIFRDSAVTNLTEFFERFRQLNVRSNSDLDALVNRAQQLIGDVNAQTLRDNAALRQQIAQQMTRVQASIDGMMVNMPRRRIIRNTEESS
jgi:hypothetical protein